MTTAYEEALKLIESGESNNIDPTPNYIVSADTLSVANNNESFVESAVNAVQAIPKFIGVSMISGANQIYNIPTDIGNLVGGDFERTETSDVIASLDSDLSAFYEENKEGADLVGFIASSIVPGMAGVKVLNAGQTSLRAAIGAGKFGKNTSKALGLLVPAKEKLMAKAIKEVANNSSAASLLQRNSLKAIGAGLGQNALEVAAFETAVAATLFESPILENQDFGDFVANIAFGAGVFGLIGGAIDATKLSFAIKSAANKAAIEARPWQFIDEAAKASDDYEKIVLDYEQLKNIPDLPNDVDEARYLFLKNASETKVNTLERRIRTNLASISGGDQDVAEALFQTFKSSPVEDAQSAFIGMQEAVKAGNPSKLSARIDRLTKKVESGKATTEEIEEFAESNLATAYARIWGDDTGRVTPDQPVLTSLVDTLKKGQSIKVTQRGVSAGNKKYRFDTRFNKGKAAGSPKAAWNIMKADPFEAQARYIWAQNLPKFEPTAGKKLTIDVNDIPLMEKAMKDLTPENRLFVDFVGLAKGETVGPSLQDFIGAKKLEIANRMLEIRGEASGKVRPLVQDEIAAIVNVRSRFLSGEMIADPVSLYSTRDILALQTYAEDYTKKLVEQGSRKITDPVVEIWNVPQHIKMTYDTTPFQGVNNFVIENMVIIKEQQKLYQEANARASAAILGDDYFKLEDINSGKVFRGAVPSGAGSGFASAASSNYGTLAASVENIGAVTSRLINKFKQQTRESLEPILYRLANNQEAAIEWSVINQRTRNTEGLYGLNEAGDALEPLAILRWKQATKAATEAGEELPSMPNLPAGMEEVIELKTQEVRDLARAHIDINGQRTAGLAGIRTAQGVQFNRAPDAFYPIPVNPRDYPHFALVTDESVTSGGHVKTLYASTAEELDGMIQKLKSNPQLKIRTKKEAEDYYRSIGQWDYEKTLNNNYLDVEAHRKGVSAPFLPATDPQKITSDMLTWHMQRETGLVREAVAAKYEVQFEELRRLGDEFTNIATSKFSNQSLLEFADESVNNPFGDYIKTALGVRKEAQYPWWIEPNKMVDRAISRLLKRATDVVEKSKTADELKIVNDMLEKAGYKGAAYDESMEIFANATPAQGMLSTVVQKANSILATVVLRWDALNSVNNAVSANVLLGAETKAVTRAIMRGDDEAVGALAKLTRIKVPGTEDTIFSPSKLIANAARKFNRNSDEMKWYKENGYITSISDQYRDSLDALTFTGRESIEAWDSRINGLHAKLRNAADAGERWTGNRLAEEFNRFVAADVMKQMTDVAVSRNLMTAKEQLAYINTFVNRTQGNYLAAQRPMMFQGPIGQAIGLFQTYQFNLLQQLLRHVGQGHARDSMTLLGLQGTIHGMNGLPAFNALNTHLVGTASGNTEHRDAYDAVYGIFGKEAGDWVTYGIGSNAIGLLHPDLKVNLYTRGDINPRHVSIVPTNPAAVPIVQATGKFMGNIIKTAKTLGAGGDFVQTILQGLEHNGISRPLAGLAQTLQGTTNLEQASYSTSKRGNVIAANDLLSLTNLTRIIGGKPIDEAIALDATYRYKAYGLVDTRKKAILGRAIKSELIAGGAPTREQIEQFALDYAAIGGKQKEFNKWFTQLYKTANLSQANEISRSTSSPFSRSMQRIMGGEELRDFTR